MTTNQVFEDEGVGAFVPHGRLTRRGSDHGSLAGLTIAVKDLFDWSGVATGAGNPTWLATHPVPTADAEALAVLLGAGATLAGKTITDELAYSIHGDNLHYGTPANPGAPGRVPGGSSSGSASAVAAGLVDAALGTDTGGSVRVPAAYCGVFGLRTTHGLVPRTGLVPLAPSFDTVGWFARTTAVLDRVAAVLVPETSWSLSQAFTLAEADELTDNDTRRAQTEALSDLGLPVTSVQGLTEPFGGLEGLRKTYVTLQGWEAWQTHGDWIQSAHPTFAPAIADRFQIASRVTRAAATEARGVLEAFRTALRSLLGTKGVLVLPATAGPAPRIGEAPEVVDAVRTRTMRLTCLAGLAGVPQLTLPRVGADGLPRGVGLVGPALGDRGLIALADRVRR